MTTKNVSLVSSISLDDNIFEQKKTPLRISSSEKLSFRWLHVLENQDQPCFNVWWCWCSVNQNFGTGAMFRFRKNRNKWRQKPNKKNTQRQISRKTWFQLLSILEKPSKQSYPSKAILWILFHWKYFLPKVPSWRNFRLAFPWASRLLATSNQWWKSSLGYKWLFFKLNCHHKQEKLLL